MSAKRYRSLAGLGLGLLLVGVGVWLFVTGPRPSGPPEMVLSGDYLIALPGGYEIGYGPYGASGNTTALLRARLPVVVHVDKYSPLSAGVAGTAKPQWFVCSSDGLGRPLVERYARQSDFEVAVTARLGRVPELRTLTEDASPVKLPCGYEVHCQGDSMGAKVVVLRRGGEAILGNIRAFASAGELVVGRAGRQLFVSREGKTHFYADTTALQKALVESLGYSPGFRTPEDPWVGIFLGAASTVTGSVLVIRRVVTGPSRHRER